jgi:hypothetical protein
MHFGSEGSKEGLVVGLVSVELVPLSLVAYNGDISAPCFDEEETGVSILVSWVTHWDDMDMRVYGAGGLVVKVGDGQIYLLAFARVGRGEKEVESSVTAATATLLS